MEIVLKDITYRHNQHTIFHKLNIHLKGSNIVGIMGLNNTILLEIIDSITIPNAGTIQLGCDTINKNNLLNCRRTVSLIMQDINNQLVMDKVKDEINFIIKALNYKHQNIEKRIADSLTIVGLDTSYLNRSINSLSSGEKKLIQVALGLISNPSIIMFDEPFRELDYIYKRKLIRLIKLLKNKYQKTIIIASNDSNMLYALTDEVVILNNKKEGYTQGKTLEIFKNIELLKESEIAVPDLIEFTHLALNKKVKLSFHRDILDLIKDIYKHV